MIISCASKTRCNEILATIKPLLENENSEMPLDILSLDHAIEHFSDVNNLYTDKGEQSSKKKKTLAFDILVTTSNNLLFLLQNGCFEGLKQRVVVSSIVVDKIDLHLATDLGDELIECGSLIQPRLIPEDSEKKTKIILTTNEQEKGEEFNSIKKAFLKEEKAVIIKLKEQKKSSTRYESVGHLRIDCDSELQKFLIFYTL